MMKIGPIESKVTSTVTTGTERRNGPAPTVAKTEEPSAKVVLSANAAAASADGSTFDKAKVERIASAIREGRFQVDSGAIADKLIQNAQEVLGRLRN
jgi:negative regulator of flagellin synthesis FlgM